MASTPLYKKLKTNGNSFYAFPSAAEDISAAYQNSNYKMYFSKYVLLNLPKQNLSPGTSENAKPIYFDFDNSFSKSPVATAPADYKEQLIELVSGLESVDPHYKIIGFVNSDGADNFNLDFNAIKNINVEELEHYVRNNSISEIVIATQKTDGITVSLYNQLIHLLEIGIIIKEYTQLYETITQRIPVHYVSRDFYRYFPFSRNNQNQLYKIMTRITDVVFSIIGLLIGLVFLPLIFFGNLIGNKGKLFYHQERIGKNGKIFTIYKFRTMIENAEKDGAVFTTSNDTRVTSFGKFLRKTRLDEFPQFFNILRGEMAIIGPRPERAVFVTEIAELMPFYETRHVIKPGLTGWAQVNYAYGESVEDSLMKLRYDLYYIKHRSLFLDLNVIVKTLNTVLFFKGQ